MNHLEPTCWGKTQRVCLRSVTGAAAEPELMKDSKGTVRLR